MGKIIVDKDGTLRVADTETEILRKAKITSLVKRAFSLLEELKDSRKDLHKSVLAMVGIRQKFAENAEEVDEKDVKKEEKSVDKKIDVVDTLLDKLKEVVNQILESQGEAISNEEKDEIKKLLEEVDEEEVETEEDLEEAEKELLKEKPSKKEEKEEKEEEEEKEKKAASVKTADINEIKEKAKTIVDKSSSVQGDKDAIKSEIDLAKDEQEVNSILEKTKAKTTAASIKRDLLKARLRSILAKRKPLEETGETLPPKMLYEDAGVRKDYFKGKDVEDAAAKSEIAENDAWRKELKKMDRSWMYRGEQIESKVASKIGERRDSLRILRAFDLAAEKQFKGLIENPLREALIDNLVKAGFDDAKAVEIVDRSFFQASERNFDVLKDEAQRMATIDSSEFVKEAKVVRDFSPQFASLQSEESTPIKTGSIERDPIKEYFKSKEDRPLGSII